MNKQEIVYLCENCGAESLKWSGRCSICGEWNTLREISISLKSKSKKQRAKSDIKPEKLSEIQIEKYPRISTGIGEFDRVLGGGLVSGSMVLLGGEPGIGKSTLILQAAGELSKAGQKVIYVSGEESKEQIKLRALRLGLNGKNIDILCDIDIDSIIGVILREKPELAIIDSIQTVYDANYPSTPGSIVQVRECALRLQQELKQAKISVIITGHVTKEGTVAGPRTLEHLVDVVVYLEGERFANTRLLRGVKNRFGPTEEVGVFEMITIGLSEVKNPSKLFLEERRESPGSAITAVLSGSRSFLVEIQALISKTPFGYPKRTVSGYDYRRLDLLLAVLEKRSRLPLTSFDVYVNIVGGMKIEDRGADLAVCGAIYSIFKNKKIVPKTALIGEVGLSGELRNVSQLDKRFKEAKALGFSNIIGPEAKTLEKALQLAIESL